MSHLHSLLAIYSALDRLVLEQPELEEIVNRYLPGTAGNAGWSEEIRRFLSNPGEPLPEYPSLEDAINDIVGEETTSTENRAESPPTASELSRLTYVVGVLSRVEGSGTGIANEALLKGLSLVVPQGHDAEEDATNLLQHLRENFRERDDWTAVMNRALESGWITPLIARIPVCHTRLKNAHGQLCVVLRTEFTSNDVSLNELKNVVNPLNWKKCLPFFCDMQPLPTPARTDGWSRVLEVCNTTCPYPPDMRTPLKFWTGPVAAEASMLSAPMAWVNYELDDTPVNPYPGDGRVLVDEGFIKLYSTGANPANNGVRVVTKKVVCFRDMSEIAIAILACVSGYGNQGMDMLLDGVVKREDDNGVGWTDWQPSARPAGQDGGASSTGSASPADTDASVPTDPTRPSRRAITLAVEMANECIDEFTKKSNTVANKMTTGKVPIAEMIALNSEFLTRLATDPWRYLERLREETSKGSK